LLYRASKHDCDPCPLKLRCCPKEPARKIPRDVNEAARDLARRQTPARSSLTRQPQASHETPLDGLDRPVAP
jgi:hypothetical protein